MNKIINVAGGILGVLALVVSGNMSAQLDTKVEEAVVEQVETLGGTVNTVPVEFHEGITVDGNTVISGTGNLTAPISSSATSTVTAGCFDGTATSSATRIKFIFNTVATTTGSGFVLWDYGTCP